METKHLEQPGPNVVLVRSVFYGAAAGALAALLVFSYELFRAFPRDFVGMALVVGSWGAGFGSATGLVLGLVLLAGRIRYPVPTFLRLTLCVLSSTVVYLVGAALFGGWNSSPLVLVVVGPPALATWFLVPVVLRPERREPMPTLPRQSE